MIVKWITFIKYLFSKVVIWYPANIYLTAKIGKGTSIGMYTEVGHNVNIGKNCRIGKGCFIPEGVSIGDDCFIGPHTCFSNDMYPPASKDEWEHTYVSNGASIGANVSVRPGVHIGRYSLIGMGSVVVCDIPANEIWVGVPAKRIRRKSV